MCTEARVHSRETVCQAYESQMGEMQKRLDMSPSYKAAFAHHFDGIGAACSVEVAVARACDETCRICLWQ